MSEVRGLSRQIQFEPKPETTVADHSTGATITANDPSSSVRGIDALGWAQIEALETRLRLSSFAEDWDAPGTDAYEIDKAIGHCPAMQAVDQALKQTLGLM